MGADFEEAKKVGLRFTETMAGYLAEGVGDYEEGERVGQRQNNDLSFEVTIQIEDVEDFCKLSGRKARLEGVVSYRPLGQNLPIRDGEFSLFRADEETGKRHMTYSFAFTGSDGNDYFLHGYKVIYDDPGQIDMLEDMTRLFTRIYMRQAADGPSIGSGILRFPVRSLPSMLASFQVTHTPSLFAKVRAVSRFYEFCYGEIRDTYLSQISPIYHTEYENLVLNGKLQSTSGYTQNFFFFSGIHDKDFPRGDDGIFRDVAFIIQQAGGSWAWTRW